MTGQEVEGCVVTAQARIWPYAAVLPMGWSWSLFFAQDVSSTTLKGVTKLRGTKMASDRGEAIVLEGAGAPPRWHYLYVDNVGVLAEEEPYVREVLCEAEVVFRRAGLTLHEGTVTEGATVALGAEVDGWRQRTRLTDERLWRLRRALQFILGLKGGVHGQELEIILGHCTFCGLVAHESLSVWHCVYKFIEKC